MHEIRPTPRPLIEMKINHDQWNCVIGQVAAVNLRDNTANYEQWHRGGRGLERYADAEDEAREYDPSLPPDSVSDRGRK